MQNFIYRLVDTIMSKLKIMREGVYDNIRSTPTCLWRSMFSRSNQSQLLSAKLERWSGPRARTSTSIYNCVGHLCPREISVNFHVEGEA